MQRQEYPQRVLGKHFCPKRVVGFPYLLRSRSLNRSLRKSVYPQRDWYFISENDRKEMATIRCSMVLRPNHVAFCANISFIKRIRPFSTTYLYICILSKEIGEQICIEIDSIVGYVVESESFLFFNAHISRNH